MSPGEPVVSIVLPVYNGSRHLSAAIDSVRSQTYTNWELIIVDDGSRDDSGALAACAADADDRIRVVSNAVNTGLPASLNRGFAEARGQLWTWTSHDNEYLPDALQALCDALVADAECGLVYADFVRIDETGVELEIVELPGATSLFYGNCVGACFLYRAVVAECVGEYRVDLALVEDYEYWLRFSKQARLCHLERVLYRYRTHPQALSVQREAEVALRDVRMRQESVRLDEVPDEALYFRSLNDRLFLYRWRAMRIPRLWRQRPSVFARFIREDVHREYVATIDALGKMRRRTVRRLYDVRDALKRRA